MVVHLYQKIYYIKIYNKATIFNELILTSFSPFDIKCIKPNANKPLEMFLGASRRVNFAYFP